MRRQHGEDPVLIGGAQCCGVGLQFAELIGEAAHFGGVIIGTRGSLAQGKTRVAHLLVVLAHRRHRLVFDIEDRVALGLRQVELAEMAWSGSPVVRAHHMMRTNDRGAAPRHFRQLNLTQAQRNSIFDIKYKSMPTMRQHYQQMRDTRLALREASAGANYDAAKVRSLADKLGKLQADAAALRAADQHRIFAVLTPQQQTQLQKMRDMRPAFGAMRGPGAGFGPGVPAAGTDS